MNAEGALKRCLARKGSSLLIRGSPGSGKTLMALSLISSHEGDFFYISTRVSPEEILEIYPHLGEEIQRIKVLDASKEISLVDATMKRFRREEDQISDFLLSVRYEDKPAFIRSLLSLLKDSENPLVVVDSLEAVQETLGKEILFDLLELSDELGFSLVLIVERAGMGKEDYLVDGVVELRREIVDEAVLRKMRIEKLRGCSIEQPEYLFTLKGGRFRVFPPFFFELPDEPKLFEPLDDPDENHFSSGSRDLDEIFGGFPKGSSILLEISEGVTREMYHPILYSFILNFLRKGRKVYEIPTLGTDREDVVKSFIPFVKEEELEKFIWIEREWGRRRLKKDEVAEEADRIYEILMKEERAGSYEDLHITGVDASFSRYGEECIRVFEEGNAFVQETRGLRIRIAKPGFPFMKELSNLSDIHVKMENVCNVPVIRGVKPKTQYYAMLVDLSEGFPRLRFEKVE